LHSEGSKLERVDASRAYAVTDLRNELPHSLEAEVDKMNSGELVALQQQL
jgi:GTPase Era involved in 16S rRNA processing